MEAEVGTLEVCQAMARIRQLDVHRLPHAMDLGRAMEIVGRLDEADAAAWRELCKRHRGLLEGARALRRS